MEKKTNYFPTAVKSVHRGSTRGSTFDPPTDRAFTKTFSTWFHNSRDAVTLMQLPKHMRFLRYKRARERNISCLIERKRKTLSIKLEQKHKIKRFLWKKKRLSRFACTPLTPSCFSDDWNEIQPHHLTMVIS